MSIYFCQAFMMGKLKVKGNILLLQKLNALWLELQKMGKTPEVPLLSELLTEVSANYNFITKYISSLFLLGSYSWLKK